MSADDIYAAGLCHGLELAAGESYNGVGRSQQRTSLSGRRHAINQTQRRRCSPASRNHLPDGVSYYVVAMARRSSSDLSLLEMHERSSCHPGMRTTVGWTVPIGYLVNTSQISVGEQCNFPKGKSRWAGVCGCVCARVCACV